MPDTIKNVGVIGLGVMGFDIAFLYAMKGYATRVYDSAPSALELVSRRKNQAVERLSKRHRISGDEIKSVEANLLTARSLADLRDVDLITEAVSEDERTKTELYREVAAAGFRGILTTNTSSIPRENLLSSGALPRSIFATTHFFNPVLYTQMVELVRGDMDRAAFATILDFLKSLGRSPVETRDISGFVSNSILMFYAVMALRLLEAGGRIQQIDAVTRALKMLPPFVSFDSWRPSIVADVTRIMDEIRGDRFLRSSRLLPIIARENPKFYVDQKPNETLSEIARKGEQTLDDDSIRRALDCSIRIAAVRSVELGESPAVVDFIATEGLKLPLAPCNALDKSGASREIENLTRVNRTIGGDPLSPPSLLQAMAAANETFFKEGKPNPWLSPPRTD
jgi:3-hydroxyacyl-CoA dehydrogenase